MPIHSSRTALSITSVASLLLLAGCSVGPDYQSASSRAGMPESYVGQGDQPKNIPSTTTAQSSDFRAWWLQLNDPTLTSLIDRALRNNLDLKQGVERVRQSRLNRDIVEAGLYPSLDASGGISRSRNSSGSHGSLFRLGLDAAWEADVFGGIRRNVESADALTQVQIEDLRDLQVILAGEVAFAYFDLLGSQQQLGIALENLAAQEQTATLTKRRFEAGFVSRLDVVNAEALVTSTQARIPTFRTNVRQSIFSLDVLLGQEPGTLLPELARSTTPQTSTPVDTTTATATDAPVTAPAPASGALPAPQLSPQELSSFSQLPLTVPIGLPSELILRRPDVRRADANLHATTAQIGVAVSDMFPRFFINASGGFEGPDFTDLGTLARRTWSIGPSFSWQIFRAGAIQSNIDVQRSRALEAFRFYQSTVLIALSDVEKALVAYQQEQVRQELLLQSVDASRKAVNFATELYKGGRTDFLNVLNAQRQLLDTQSTQIESKRLLLSNLTALYKALGGGWDPDYQPLESLPELPKNPSAEAQ